MKRNIIAYWISPLLAAAVLCCACQRDIADLSVNTDCLIGYSGSLRNFTAGTKGTPVNEGTASDALDEFVDALDEKKFFVSAWDIDGTPAQCIPAGTAVSYSADTPQKWVAKEYIWKKTENNKVFYAYANLPEGASVTNPAATYQELSYTVPTTASAQKDILLGYYSGNGGETRTADLMFHHPLTAVRFKAGELGGATLNSITISGVHSSGSVRQNSDTPGSFTWSASGSTSVSMSSVSDDEAFILIPQAFTDEDAMIEFNLTTAGGTADCLHHHLKGTVWEAGKLYEYTVGYYPYEYSNLEISALSSYNLTKSNDKAEIRIASDAPWVIQYSSDGTNWNNVPEDTKKVGKWLEFDKVKGDPDDGAVVNLSVLYGGEEEVEFTTDHFANLRNAAPKGTEDAPWDLSIHDIYGLENEGGKATTANCYVINSPGWYALPLVYGNAIKGGTDNTAAYKPERVSGTSDSNFLSPFLGTNGEITSPYIEGVSKGQLVWKDTDNDIIDSFQVLSPADALGKGLKGVQYCCYLLFRIKKDNLVPGNALVAVTDGTDILWSWHIWITDNDLGARPITNNQGWKFDVMAYNLGWVDTTTGGAPAQTTTQKGLKGEEVYVRIAQTKGEEVKKASPQFSVIRKEYVTSIPVGEGVYCQNGRKDPFHRKTYKSLTVDASTGSIAYSIKHPDTFFKVKTGLIVFGNAGQSYANLWNAIFPNFDGATCKSKGSPNQYPVKSIYDPCPPGFQVPNFYAFTGFTNNGQASKTKPYQSDRLVEDKTIGMSFRTDDGGSISFPHNGYLSVSGGDPSYLDNTGWYWTLGHNGQGSSWAFVFHPNWNSYQGIFPQDDSSSGYAFSIRPVKER